MRHIIILISSRVINGIFGLILLVILRSAIDDNSYSNFSSNFAYLTMLSTFAGGVLSGLLLKNAFSFGTQYKNIVFFYLLMFMGLTVIPIELSMILKVFVNLSRLSIYIFIASHLFSSVSLIHYQLKQKFVYMTSVEIFRTVFPLVLIFILKNFVHISVDEIIILLACGNLLGVYYFIKCARLSYDGEFISVKHYLREKVRSDLTYGFSFASFNGLAQFVIAKDRNFIFVNNGANQGSKMAYTADQLTKITNGVLFPLNTKISSELGGLIRNRKIKLFHRNLMRYSLLTLGAGALITVGIYLVTSLFGSKLPVINGLDLRTIFYYGLANAIYLTALVYQKRFDYTRYKLLPTIFLLLSAGISFGVLQFLYVGISYFFLTSLFYGIFLVCSGFILPNQKLKLNL
jgi:hypothetical protein